MVWEYLELKYTLSEKDISIVVGWYVLYRFKFQKINNYKLCEKIRLSIWSQGDYFINSNTGL